MPHFAEPLHSFFDPPSVFTVLMKVAIEPLTAVNVR